MGWDEHVRSAVLLQTDLRALTEAVGDVRPGAISGAAPASPDHAGAVLRGADPAAPDRTMRGAVSLGLRVAQITAAMASATRRASGGGTLFPTCAWTEAREPTNS